MMLGVILGRFACDIDSGYFEKKQIKYSTHRLNSLEKKLKQSGSKEFESIEHFEKELDIFIYHYNYKRIEKIKRPESDRITEHRSLKLLKLYVY
ncbi:hypothetical protein ACIQXF_09435 [Lysinibacillus sp. NPDC097231]|uniref:hypothetical protein n=1 Tax=Lysinibacillus sp. NPDC097231 TaxID=3364142 RepID=UPI003803134A